MIIHVKTVECRCGDTGEIWISFKELLYQHAEYILQYCYIVEEQVIVEDKFQKEHSDVLVENFGRKIQNVVVSKMFNLCVISQVTNIGFNHFMKLYH